MDRGDNGKHASCLCDHLWLSYDSEKIYDFDADLPQTVSFRPLQLCRAQLGRVHVFLLCLCCLLVSCTNQFPSFYQGKMLSCVEEHSEDFIPHLPLWCSRKTAKQFRKVRILNVHLLTTFISDRNVGRCMKAVCLLDQDQSELQCRESIQ